MEREDFGARPTPNTHRHVVGAPQWQIQELKLGNLPSLLSLPSSSLLFAFFSPFSQPFLSHPLISSFLPLTYLCPLSLSRDLGSAGRNYVLQ